MSLKRSKLLGVERSLLTILVKWYPKLLLLTSVEAPFTVPFVFYQREFDSVFVSMLSYTENQCLFDEKQMECKLN